MACATGEQKVNFRMNTVSIHLVTWNGAKYIPYLFASLRAQTYRDMQLYIIDNGSADGTVEAIERELQSFPFPYDFVKLATNTGFAPAHNALMRKSNAQFCLLLNQDMYLMPDHIEKLVACMQNNARIGSCMGRLMRWDFSAAEGPRFMQLIDSLGLAVMRSRRVVDWHTGKRWDEVFPQLRIAGSGIVPIFGVPGTLPLYRRSAIEDVQIDGQMFDETYFSYKEDVDLAWRLALAGWESAMVPNAVAYHDRTAAGPMQLNDKAAADNRKKKSGFVNYHSYKNHLFTLIKNEQTSNYLRDWLWIEWYEWKKFIYLLLFEFRTWRALGEVIRKLPEMMRKRKIIRLRRRVQPRDLRHWWMTS